MSLLALLALALPSQASDADLPFAAVCYGPYREHESPQTGVQPLASWAARDLRTAARLAPAVRIYGTDGAAALMPAYCRENGLKLVAGAWVAGNVSANQHAVDMLCEMARLHPETIPLVVVGNETLLRGEQTEAQMVQWLRIAAGRVTQPVAAAEPWHVWLESPGLAAACDTLLVHVYPYWDGVPVGQAADYTLDRLREVQAKCPDKRLVLGEFGWPGAGPRREGAVAGAAEQARYFRETLPRLKAARIDAYAFELFDEPWKDGPEAGVGGSFGLLTTHGRVKPALADLLELPQDFRVVRPPRSFAPESLQMSGNDEVRGGRMKIR